MFEPAVAEIEAQPAPPVPAEPESVVAADRQSAATEPTEIQAYALPTWLDDLSERQRQRAMEPLPPIPLHEVPAVASVEESPEPAPLAPATIAPSKPASAKTKPKSSSVAAASKKPIDRLAHDFPDEERIPDFLSPRLRSKLARARGEEPDSRSPIGAWVVGSVTIVGLAVLLLFFLRLGPWAQKSEVTPEGQASRPATEMERLPSSSEAASTPAPVTSRPTQKVASSRVTVAKTTGTQRVASGSTTPAGTAQSSPVRSEPASSSSPQAPAPERSGAAAGVPSESAPPPAPARTFGVVVGSFLNQDRANSEKTRLATSTGLPSRIVTINEDGAPMFRVVLGAFPARAEAEQAASDLVGRGLINEARVTTLAAAR